MSSPPLAYGNMVKGEAMKVDKAAGRLTLKHGPIKNLDMDSMTMVFRVVDPEMLDTVKAGDRIEFEAARVIGAITITRNQQEPLAPAQGHGEQAEKPLASGERYPGETTCRMKIPTTSSSPAQARQAAQSPAG